MNSPKVLATIRLTVFQTKEVSWGLHIDETDGKDPWGELRPFGKKRPRAADLFVYDLDAAIYRVSSSRDICRDNGLEDRRERARARSLHLLLGKLIAAAGGKRHPVARDQKMGLNKSFNLRH